MTGYGLAAIGPGIGIGFDLAEARAMIGGLGVVVLVAGSAPRYGTGAATCKVGRA